MAEPHAGGLQARRNGWFSGESRNFRGISAWEGAEAWKATKDRNDAEDRLVGRAKALKPNEYTRTRLSYEKVWGELDDIYAPARHLVELLQQQLEEGEFKADQLSEVPAFNEAEGEPELVPTMAKDGSVKFRKTAKVGNAPPSGPEELRRRLRILGNGYLFVRLRHPSHALLSTASTEMWAGYCDFLLGPRVLGTEVRN